MEFRDIIGVGSLALALVTFAYNWLNARGWQRKSNMRDELVRFVIDEHVASTVTAETLRTAERAAVYLSLELAETARMTAVRQARRAAGGFTRALVLYGILLLIAIPLFIVAGVLGWSQPPSFGNSAATAYFFLAPVVLVTSYVLHLRKLRRVHRNTAELNAFREEVIGARSLTARDVKVSRPK